MTIVAAGRVRKVFVELEPESSGIVRIVFCLENEKWYEFLGVSLQGSDGFKLPDPLGCRCTVTDISDKHWDRSKYEIDFASSYSRDGVFWASECHEVNGIGGS